MLPGNRPCSPTAQALPGETAVTASRVFWGCGLVSGLGVGTWVQFVPFQCAMNVRAP